MRNKGFTMMELVVVMAIIAILAAMLVPAVNRARKKAAINKAEAEMASLASTGGMIYLDTGYYICLDDYTNTDTSRIYKFTKGTATGKEEKVNDTPNWDGPYTTWQPSQIFSSTNGSVLTGTGATWNYTPDTPEASGKEGVDFRYGAPLDPWNHPYCLAWNNTEEVMVIYSAGPDGIVQTNAGAVVPATNSDDLLYKFK